MKLRLVFFAVWLAHCAVGRAQSDFSYRMRYLTTEEGLSQNTVDDILRDSQGFMWFATWNGLCRFDGYHFQVFKAENSPIGLPGNFVQTLCESPRGRLWIGASQGLGVFDLEKSRFLPMDWASENLRHANVSSLIVDGSGNIWVGSIDQGIFCLTPDAHGGPNYTISHFPLPNNPVYALLARKGGGCWIGTLHGIWKADHPLEPPVPSEEWRIPAAPVRETRCMWQDSDGVFWAGTDYGLFRFGAAGAPPQVFFHNPDNPGTLVHNTVNALVRDLNGDLLVGALGGLCKYEGGNRFARMNGGLTDRTRLNNPFVNSLLCDQYGNVWIGTEKGGVNAYNLFEKKFYILTHEQGNLGSLSHKTVNSLLAEDKYLWVGTAGGGLNRVDRASNRITYAQYDPHAPASLSSDFITAIHRDRKQSLWLATWGGGINRMKGDDMRAFQRFQKSSSGLPSDFISSIWEDPSGFLLIGSSAGLCKLDLATEKVATLRLGEFSTESHQIGCLLRDRQGYYWVGSRRGLYRFPSSAVSAVSADLKLEGIEFFQAGQLSTHNLPGDYIISLHEDRQGNIWLGTFGDGLIRVRVENGQVSGFETFNQSHGLCNNTVYSMEEDQEGGLWLTTDNGLSRFRPGENRFLNFFKSDGLADNQFYWSASCKDPEGVIYVGGVNGLTYFSPEEIHAYRQTPKAAFSDFRVFHHSLAVGETRHGRVALPKTISYTDTVYLSYRDNVFSIEFTALNYHLPERVTYFYQMETVDQDWVEAPSERRFATYTNLAGGAYRFRLKVANEDGLRSEEEAILTIIIRPPFYATAWFILFMAGLALAAVMLYIRLRTKYLYAQKRKLEQEVERRTRKIEEQKAELEAQKQNLIELNEKVKMVNQFRLRFFTNVSHEFRTPLTLIINPMESLMDAHPMHTSTGKTLRMMYRNGQRLLYLLNQLMSFRKLESGKLRIRAEERDLADFLREVSGSFEELAQHQEIHFNCSITGKPAASTWMDAEKLEHVLYNLLSNAFKFTPRKGRINLNLSYLQAPDHQHRACIEVSDTGVGIPAAQQRRIFDPFYQVGNPENRSLHGSGIGLALAKELVTSMRGEITVHSEPERGATFRILLPYLREDFAKSEREFQPVSYLSNLTTQVALAKEEISHAEHLLPIARSESQDREKPLLLIVEDNHDLRDFLSQSLAPSYRILEADNGKDALEMARKYTPHLIVSDIMMPVMDGLELCSRLKGQIQTSHIPVILLTARNMVEHWVEGLETGADDYVSKPFNLRILISRIENLIASRRQLKLLFSKEERPHTETVTTNKLDQQFLQSVYDLLDQHEQDATFSHDDLATALCMSRSLLYKKIKALTGMSVTEFSNSHRLRQAAKLLNAGEIPISEIAYRCGFNDPKYFSRLFRKYYGMTPSDYSTQQFDSVSN